jgi:hypothetical protein
MMHGNNVGHVSEIMMEIKYGELFQLNLFLSLAPSTPIYFNSFITFKQK